VISNKVQALNVLKVFVRSDTTEVTNLVGHLVGILAWRRHFDRARVVVVHKTQLVSELHDVFWFAVFNRIVQNLVMSWRRHTYTSELADHVEVIGATRSNRVIDDCSRRWIVNSSILISDKFCLKSLIDSDE